MSNKKVNREPKSVRKIKVCESSGYRYKSTPSILLKGDWLEAFGFSINTPLTVTCENGKLVITPYGSCEYPVNAGRGFGAVAEDSVYNSERGD